MPKLIKCKDHLGNEYNSVKEMCQHWGISQANYLYRIKSGLSVNEALTNRVRSRGVVEDHLGNRFNSVEDMCEHWGVPFTTYNARIKLGWSKNRALTTSVQKWGVKDHTGKEFENASAMCRHWGIEVSTYRIRISRGASVEEALTKDIVGPKISIRAFGTEYSTLGEASKSFNLDKSTVIRRLRRGFDVEVALLNYSKSVRGIEFIGLNGKSYYTVSWSKTYVTARQIIEHYRPDLVEAYDRSNPTGEYRPYKAS